MSTRYFLLGAEIGEVVMVGPDFERLRMSFKVVAEVFKGADDGEEFFVVDIVVLFGWQHGFGVKGNRVPAIKSVWLFQDGSKGKVACVCDDAERQGRVWEAQDRGSGEGFDEGAESRVLVGMPGEGGVLLGKFKERASNGGVILDKSAVEITEAEEGLEIFEFLREWPVGNAGKFCRVHFDLAMRNDDAKVVDRRLVKGTFLRLEVEVVFGKAGQDLVSKGV